MKWFNAFAWYTQECVNRRTKRAFLSGNTPKYHHYYRTSVERWRENELYELMEFCAFGPRLNVPQNADGTCTITVVAENPK